MDAGESAARPDVAFKSAFLTVGEDVPGSAQEHDHFVSSKLHVGKAGGIFVLSTEKPWSASRP
jgi:hypothetical protein